MPHLFAAAALAVAVALGAVPAFAQVPAAQTAAPEASPLPEIGRVRSTAPACAAMRDLDPPVVRGGAARGRAFRGDARAVAAVRRDRGRARSTRTTCSASPRSAKLDADATALLNETLVLDKALGDPRFKNTSDPQVIAAQTAAASSSTRRSRRARTSCKSSSCASATTMAKDGSATTTRSRRSDAAAADGRQRADASRRAARSRRRACR